MQHVLEVSKIFDQFTVKNRVKVARVEKGLTQEQLASLVGITRQTIGLIEAGKYNPSIRLCLFISHVVEKKVHEIFWLEEDKQ